VLSCCSSRFAIFDFWILDLLKQSLDQFADPSAAVSSKPPYQKANAV